MAAWDEYPQPETMVPHHVEIGERYSDDSGWQKLVRIDTHAHRFEIELGASTLSADLNDLSWLIHALSRARGLVKL